MGTSRNGIWQRTCILFILALSVLSCGKQSSAPLPDSASGVGDGIFGQISLPPSAGKAGPENAPQASLPPQSTDGEHPAIPGTPEEEDVPPNSGFRPFQMPPGYRFEPIYQNWGDLSRFDVLRRLPDDIFIRTLFCQFSSTNTWRPDEAYSIISGFHLDLLARLASSDELTKYSQKYPTLSSESTRQQLASDIIKSEEFGRKLATVHYWSLLRRAPTDAERDTWAKNIAAGQSLESQLVELMATQEYFNLNVSGTYARQAADVSFYGAKKAKAKKRPKNHKRPTPAAQAMANFLAAVVRDVLGRNTATWEIVNLPLGSAGNLLTYDERKKIAQYIIDSDEGRLKFIEFAHVLYLGRYATAYDRQRWLNEMKGGKQRLEVIRDLVASQENYEREMRRLQRWTGASTASNSCTPPGGT